MRLSHDPSANTWSTGSFGAVLLPHLTRHTSSAPVRAICRHNSAPTNSRSASSSTPGPSGPSSRASPRASVCSPVAYGPWAASTTACVPASTSPTTRTCGNAPTPPPAALGATQRLVGGAVGHIQTGPVHDHDPPAPIPLRGWAPEMRGPGGTGPGRQGAAGGNTCSMPGAARAVFDRCRWRRPTARMCREAPQAGLTRDTTGVLPSGRSVDQTQGPPGTTSPTRDLIGAWHKAHRSAVRGLAGRAALSRTTTEGTTWRACHTPSGWSPSGSTATRTPTWPRPSTSSAASWAPPRRQPPGQLRRRAGPLAGRPRPPGRGGQPAQPANPPAARQVRPRRRRGRRPHGPGRRRGHHPKTAGGTVEVLRVLRVARRSAVKARTQAANQLDSLLVTAPDQLRAQLRGLAPGRLVEVAASLRPGELASPVAATKLALRELARRHQALTAELDRLDSHIAKLAPKASATLLARRGVGPQTAAGLLVAAGDNPDRLRSEAAFSMLRGSSPIEASSGKTTRHRLNRGGDRQANNALWVTALSRMASDQPTKDYVERRTKQGKSKKDIIRCLKRYTAREVYRDLKAAIAT